MMDAAFFNEFDYNNTISDYFFLFLIHTFFYSKYLSIIIMLNIYAIDPSQI